MGKGKIHNSLVWNLESLSKLGLYSCLSRLSSWFAPGNAVRAQLRNTGQDLWVAEETQAGSPRHQPQPGGQGTSTGN